MSDYVGKMQRWDVSPAARHVLQTHPEYEAARRVLDGFELRGRAWDWVTAMRVDATSFPVHGTAPALAFSVQGTVEHRETGIPVPLRTMRDYLAYGTERDAEDRFLHFLHGLLRDVVLHELDESVWVGGKLVRDPHARER